MKIQLSYSYKLLKRGCITEVFKVLFLIQENLSLTIPPTMYTVPELFRYCNSMKRIVLVIKYSSRKMLYLCKTFEQTFTECWLY